MGLNWKGGREDEARDMGRSLDFIFIYTGKSLEDSRQGMNECVCVCEGDSYVPISPRYFSLQLPRISLRGSFRKEKTTPCGENAVSVTFDFFVTALSPSSSHVHFSFSFK